MAPPQPLPTRGSLPPRGAPASTGSARRVVPPVPVVDQPKRERQSSLPPLPPLPPSPGPRYQAPPLQMAKRIPTDLPYVVSPRGGQWALRYLIPLIVLLVPATVLWVLWEYQAALFATLATVALYIVFFGFRLYTQARGGPFLAADREGVWLRVQKMPIRSAKIPWELIAEIRPRRWILDRAICVVTRDARVAKLPGMWGSIDQARTKAFFGVPLTATISFGNKPADDTLAALTAFAQGRAKVVGAPARPGNAS